MYPKKNTYLNDNRLRPWSFRAIGKHADKGVLT